MGTLQRTQRSTLLSSLTTLVQYSKSAAITTLKNEISESFTCLDEFNAAHLTASNHLRLYLQERDSFSARQLKLKEIKEKEVISKVAFLQITQKIEEKETRLATLRERCSSSAKQRVSC